MDCFEERHWSGGWPGYDSKVSVVALAWWKTTEASGL